MATATFTTTNGSNSSTYEVTYNPVVEGGLATITVKRLSGGYTDAISWSTADGTATSADYVAANSQFSLASGQSTTFTITTKADSIVEAQEYFLIRFVDEGGNTQGLRLEIQQSINDATNTPPTGSATAVLVAGTEDVAYTVTAADLLKGFSDANGDTLSVSGLTANNGTVTDNGNGTFTITPTANYNGTVALSYNVIDGKGGSVAASQTFSLAAVNDAPTGTPTAVLNNGSEDVAYTVNTASLVSGFTDVDGDALSVANLSADHGTVTINGNGTFTITPSQDYNGQVTLSYNLIDGKGGSTAATQTFTLTAVNDAPTGAATAALPNGAEGSAYTVGTAALVAGFTDIEGDTLSVANLTTDHGTVTVNPNGTFTITPTANYAGTVNLSYSVVDGKGGSTAATQSFVLDPVNDAPTAPAANSVTTDEDTASTAVAIGAGDIDSGSLSYSVKAGSGPAKGTVSFDQAAGTFVYTPAANANGADSFTIVVSDGELTTEQLVSVTVNPVNDAPTAVADTGTAVEDGGPVALLASSLLANDIDVDFGDIKTIVSVAAGPSTVGSVQLSNGKVVYDPGTGFQSLKAGATATDSFTYTMRDAAGATSTATVTMTVTGTNDGPKAVADAAAIDEDESVTISVMKNDTDVDVGDTMTLVRVDATSALGATIYFDPTTGEVQYTADADTFDLLALGQVKNDSFTYTVRDGSGAESTATVNLTVKGVADGTTINGTVHPDTLTGTTKDESIYGDNSDDVLYGNAGADRLIGGNGSDRLYGEDGIDQLFGDNGSDVLIGGRGNDVLSGGLGPDVFVFGKHVVNGTTYNSGADVITDFKVQNDGIRLEDGLMVSSMVNFNANNDGVMDTRITLSNNATIDLLGVSNLSNPGQVLIA